MLHYYVYIPQRHKQFSELCFFDKNDLLNWILIIEIIVFWHNAKKNIKLLRKIAFWRPIFMLFLQEILNLCSG